MLINTNVCSYNKVKYKVENARNAPWHTSSIKIPWENIQYFAYITNFEKNSKFQGRLLS